MDNNLFNKVDDLSTKIDNVSGQYNDIADSLDAINKKVDMLNSKKSKGETTISPTASITQFVARSEKYYVWCDSQTKFNKTKNILISLIFGLILILLINVILSSYALKTYSIYTIIENIWLITFLFVFKKVIVSKYTWDMIKCADNSIFRQKISPDNLIILARPKIRYILAFVIYLLGIIGNIVCLWDKSVPIMLASFATVFEILPAIFSVLLIVFGIFPFFADFGCFKFTGLNDKRTAVVNIFYDPVLNQLYTEEQFNQLYN